MIHPSTFYLDNATDIEIRSRKGGRSILEISNTDAAVIYYSEDTPANSENGLPIAANTTRTWSRFGNAPEAIPSGTVWLRGSGAPGARQRVIVREG